MADIGVFMRVRVDPQNDDKMDLVMKDIRDAMAVEEFPTGEVKTYAVYRDKGVPGQWWMFQLYTEKGMAEHATGPLIYKAGTAQLALLTEPHDRTMLQPVLVHGCGESVPGAPSPLSRDESKDVGAVLMFKVAPEDDATFEQTMRDNFEAMAEEEYSTGDVISYSLFRDPSEVGRWAMFEHFTDKGAADHSIGPKVIETGMKLLSHLTEPFFRAELEPVIVLGCGGPIPGSPNA